MKTQRKLLTEEQKDKICKAYGYHCYKCPIMKEFDDGYWCTIGVKEMEDFIREFWNEEIEIEVDV